MNDSIPPRLQYLAGMSWRILAVLGLIAVFIFMVMQLSIIVIPFLVAILITALLYPAVQWLVSKGVKRGLAVAMSLVGLIVVIAGMLFLVTTQIRSAYPELRDRFGVFLNEGKAVLSREPFNIDTQNLSDITQQAISYAQANSSTLLSGLSSAGSTAGHIGAGIFLAFFAVIFLLIDGKNIWRWVANLFPRANRTKFLEAGNKGWRTLIGFVKSQVAVAGVDAVGIGLGALLLQVPLAIPIAVMVFLGSFIPVVGAVVTGLLAVVLALIFNGWLAALLMLGVVLLVQFAEGHILQPFLIGKAVKIHPLAIVFAVAIGTLLAGIPGALFAVPTVAVLNVMISHLLGRTTQTEPKQV
jgi:predicted PurR-regulated permease PerM